MKRINWGWRIVIFYSGFIAFMMFLVYKTSTVNVDLVSADYYAKELKYQDQLEKQNRANRLSEPLSWTVSGKNIVMKFPGEVSDKKITANVLFYCPSDKNRDYTMSCEPGADKECRLNAGKLQHGVYQMQVDWSAGETSYYTEGVININ